MLSYFEMQDFLPHCAVDRDHEHEEVISGQVLGILHQIYLKVYRSEEGNFPNFGKKDT